MVVRIQTNNANETRTLFNALKAAGYNWSDYSPANILDSDLSIGRGTMIDTVAKIIKNTHREMVSFVEGMQELGFAIPAATPSTDSVSADSVKAILKPGMVVERADGAQRLVANTADGLVFIVDALHGTIYNTVDVKYNDDLTHVNTSNRDIVKIYGLPTNADFAVTVDTDSRPVIWDKNAGGEEADDAVDMTLADIEALVGKKVNIVFD